MTLLMEDQRISSPSFFPAFRLYFFKQRNQLSFPYRKKATREWTHCCTRAKVLSWFLPLLLHHFCSSEIWTTCSGWFPSSLAVTQNVQYPIPTEHWGHMDSPSMHWEVQLQLVKSWPCESQLAGDGYFTSGTGLFQNWFLSIAQRFNYTFHEFISELKNHHLGLRWLPEEEGGTGQHKQVRHWSTQWLESLNHTSCWTDSLHCLCFQCLYILRYVPGPPWTPPNKTHLPRSKSIASRTEWWDTLGKSQSCLLILFSILKIIIKTTTSFGYKQHDLYKSLYELQK